MKRNKWNHKTFSIQLKQNTLDHFDKSVLEHRKGKNYRHTRVKNKNSKKALKNSDSVTHLKSVILNLVAIFPESSSERLAVLRKILT